MMDLQELKKEVAKRHNVVLGDKDPILVTLTMNELVLNSYLERMQTLFNETQERLAATTAEQRAASRDIAAQIVTGGLIISGKKPKRAVTPYKQV